MKILAVDDDAFILEILTMTVARFDFPEVVTAHSGERALSLLQSDDAGFDCFLLDISMPGMDGIELCSRIRQIERYSKTPIIMLTAMSEKDYIDRAFQAGATDYIGKPFDISEVGARLRIAKELIDARRAYDVSHRSKKVSQAESAESGLVDEVTIDSVENVVSQTALGNYLKQVSQSEKARTQVLAAIITGFDRLQSRATSACFLAALTAVAEAISAVFKPYGYMMAYAGAGRFLIVMHRPDLEPSIAAELEIQEYLDAKRLSFDDGGPMELEVSLGNPIKPVPSRTQGVWKSFQRALGRAESRAEKRLADLRPVNLR
ncbi:response regulator [Pararhodobacter oceanensis]|uniref:response regulator n=1 Tax=Pararhodobacter oceanensis TaxID=2172121 RepID=UPI003A943D26